MIIALIKIIKTIFLMLTIDEADGDYWPQRQLILLDGERLWGLETAAGLVAESAPERLIWIGNDPIPDLISAVVSKFTPDGVSGSTSGPLMRAERAVMAEAIPPSNVQRLLGGECDLLMIDLWSGLDADALGAAVGSLRGGGLVLLLAPPIADWPDWVDPEAARLAPHPYSAAEVSTRFLTRLSRLLLTSPAVLRLEGNRLDGLVRPGIGDSAHGIAVEPISSKTRPTFDPSQPATPDQAEAVAAIHALARGRARRPLVLTADRGRGKSAALGIAAGRVIDSQRSRIIVTAPRRSAVDTLFTHAIASLRATAGAAPDATAEALLSFQAPDQLLASRPSADLLLVDEAAGIPAPLLEQLLTHYPRVCFSTTVHGYEGSGRGFDIRFRALLDQATPGWRALRLNNPIRWRRGDQVEQLCNRLLLLDAEPAPAAQVAAADLASARLDLHEPASLAANEPTLRQLFGLLVLGHYQTRPNDLRHLLDGPNLEVATLSVDGVVLATALVAREGQLEQTLIQPIFEGRRRPRGHLLPQTLSAHAGLREAPRLGFARIVRIAVHPAAQRRGLGRRLVESLATRARQNGLDLLGASFGANPELLAFWYRCRLPPLHLGTHRNAASGARAAVVLQALSPAGAGLIEQARERLHRDLPILLTGPLRDAEPALIATLLREMPSQMGPIAPLDQQQIDAFAEAHHTLEAALPALDRLARQRLAGSTQEDSDQALSEHQRDLLILVILQRRHPEAVVSALGLSGRAELLQHLRETVAALRSQEEHQA
jgi:tRNA(Met) cytidine acetyltransferase